MPQSGRTFRIFVSSTFSDLVAERNALQERVFPRLRELAMAHGCRFQLEVSTVRGECLSRRALLRVPPATLRGHRFRRGR